MLNHLSKKYGRDAANRLEAVRQHNPDGARALLESFYYSFNNQDIDVFRQVWANHDLIQLNNPLGGMLRGYQAIADLYEQIFNSPARVWVELSDIIEYATDSMVIFAGRENGEFSQGEHTLPLTIRTTRVVQWFGPDTGWRQVHHHGSIDDAELLHRYQQAVRSQ